MFSSFYNSNPESRIKKNSLLLTPHIIIDIIIHPLNFSLRFLQFGAPNLVLGLGAYKMQFQDFVIKFKSLTAFLGQVWRWKKNNILCQNKNFTT